MAPAAADVPHKYDLVLNAQGYMLDRRLDINSSHEYTPTFVPRQNITGAYGDDQQDWWMVLSQNDWSEGEQQKYIRVNDGDSRRKYWRGSNVDILIEGQVSLQNAAKDYNPSSAVTASCAWRGAAAYVAGGTLYTADFADTIQSRGTIASTFTGLTAYGLASDDVNVYAAYPDSSGGAIRKWNGATPVGASTDFSTFSSALGIHSLEYINNTLYGVGSVNAGYMTLYSFDTAGVSTAVYIWEPADGVTWSSSGAAPRPVVRRMRRFGNDMLILTSHELLLFDGEVPTILAELPGTFYPTEVVTVEGIVFVGGSFIKKDSSGSNWFQRGAVFYYVDGRLDLLWKGDSFGTTSYALGDATRSANPVPWGAGILFWDDVRSQLAYYDITTGSFSGVSSDTGNRGMGANCTFGFFNGYDASHSTQFPDPATISTTGYIQTSLFDADSSLPKYWKSVKIDADIPTGATVDISYRLNDLDSTFTSLQTSAAVGTEYAISQAGRAISIQITLNKGSSTYGPVLKRIYLRGTPIQDTFRRDTYVIDCGGKFEGDSVNPIYLRNGEQHPLTGLQMATNLRTAAALTTPFTLTDEFGTYTGLIEPGSFRLERTKDREYRAYLSVRQV